MTPNAVYVSFLAPITDCTSLPTFVNGIHIGKGCAGAVWKDGSPSKQYCGNDPKFVWWANCCTWHAGKCIPKINATSEVSYRTGIIEINDESGYVIP